MNIQPGRSLLHYRIVEKIGEGGMGAVWRADDTTLGRQVAIKVLPPEFAADRDRLLRFEREAKLLASLNHPHIAAIYGLHEADGVHFLVMEMVEGENLAQRLERGALPLHEVVEIALQVAEALEAAHDNGVIHRDLKPANIELARDGKIKVLDFGLAKSLGPEAGHGDPTRSPTLTSAGTVAGMILGTASYMSPEQARGRGADRRADVWAFGCVLYEMITGRRTFEGETVSDVLASVLKVDPDWEALDDSTPPELRRLLRRCLERRPERRLAHLSGARVVLRELAEGRLDETAAPAATLAPATRAAGLTRLPWVLAALLAIVATVSLWTARHPGRDQRELLTLMVPFPDAWAVPDDQMGVMALSPDGRTLALALRSSQEKKLYVRRLDMPVLTALAGTEEASTPVFSPDGKWIAFFAGEKLKKVSVEGGNPVTLCASEGSNRGATWGTDDHIVFSPHYTLPLMQVAGAGGAPSPLTTIDRERGERTHRWPYAVPGEDLVLFTVGTMNSPESYDAARIDAIRPSTGEQRTVLEGASMAWYVPTGHLLFGRDGFLFAVPFDVKTLEVQGSPIPVVENVLGMRNSGIVHAGFAANGLLAYISGAPQSRQARLLLRHKDGRSEPLPAPVAGYVNPRFSPDRAQIAVEIEGTSVLDIWTYNLARQTSTRLTFEGDNSRPIWAPDGQRIAFASVRDDALTSIYVQAADGSGTADLLYSAAHRPNSGGAIPAGWSPDGTSIVVEYLNENASNLMAYYPAEAKEQVLLETPAAELSAALSPDGRWLAYASDESGQMQVFVRAYARSAGKWQISSDGGSAPRWSADGRALFFRWDRRLWSVDVDGSGESVMTSRPRLLFDDLPPVSVDGDYDILDSERLLLVEPVGRDTEPEGVTVLVNWLDELRRLVPQRGGGR